MKKQFSFLGLAVASLLLIGAGCSFTDDATVETEVVNLDLPAEVEQGLLTVELSATGDSVELAETVEIEDGATVLDVMEAAAEDGDFEYTTQTAEGLGEYVDTVGGLAGSGDAGFWLYYVNDEAALEGVATLEVEDGDAIEWRYEAAQ